MKQLLVLLGLLCLSGCVGYTFSENSETVTGSDVSRVDLQFRKIKPNRNADKVFPDGSEMFVLQDETYWCGLTIFAIIPIPLWLPVCSNHLEATYKEGKIVQVAYQWPKLSGYWCGPFVPIMGIDGGSQSFCREVK